MKREWNQSADKLASPALQQEEGVVATSEDDKQDLITLNCLDELLKPRDNRGVARVTAVTRSARQRRSVPSILQEAIVQRLRSEQIIQAQDEEKWIVNLKAYLQGEAVRLSAEDAKSCAKIAGDYELDGSGLLLYCPRGARSDEDRDSLVRLVVPETLQHDVLHHYHVSLESGHQGIGRTYQRVGSHFHWRSLFRSVQRFVGECVDCETGKGHPLTQGESPGNVQGTYPFQMIAMDHIPSLPKLFKGNAEQLIWVDLFTGYVIAKASASRTAQTVAENYEECVFRCFGASEVIRHDREPGFMSDFFRAFKRIVGQKQRATTAYRPQANGSAERMVQTPTRASKMYVSYVNQQDWDEYAERLTFALNTAQDRTRGDTPFYLKLREEVRRQADRHNEALRPHAIEAGSQIWLYLDRIKKGYARKLAHLWHGPFRIAEMIDRHAARLEIAGSEHHIFPIVHVSKLKLVRHFPDRPETQLVTEGSDRLNFDEGLLPEDSWDAPLGEGEFEVEKITDVRTGWRTHYGRVHRDFLVYWKGSQEPTWVDEADLNCGSLLREFERAQASRNRFEVMQSYEEKAGGTPQ
ncbi:unnamed protein product [Phytophthora fragariaefolia]|uniref:Unnamed protein product n=1 Tax=Phytophthora fragariaefolia TaxID=1490495 RepID=A0A9W6XW81_9STRA|nr:unnamed protein product [Phytophthora fragariaefolia]